MRYLNLYHVSYKKIVYRNFGCFENSLTDTKHQDQKWKRKENTILLEISETYNLDKPF